MAEVLDIIGNAAMEEQGKRKTWTPTTGTVTIHKWKGSATNADALFDSLVTLQGSTPQYDSITLDEGRGVGTVEARKLQDDTGSEAVNKVEDVYELYSSEIQEDIEFAPYYQALTGAEVQDVRLAIESGATAVDAAWSPLQGSLFFSLLKGVRSYIRSSYVLRQTQITSWRSTIQASFANVNQIDTPPNVSAINTLIGALPAGEWLKKAPNVRQYGTNQWQIVTEWWWSDRIHVMYGGSWIPSA